MKPSLILLAILLLLGYVQCDDRRYDLEIHHAILEDSISELRLFISVESEYSTSSSFYNWIRDPLNATLQTVSSSAKYDAKNSKDYIIILLEIINNLQHKFPPETPESALLNKIKENLKRLLDEVDAVKISLELELEPSEVYISKVQKIINSTINDIDGIAVILYKNEINTDIGLSNIRKQMENMATLLRESSLNNDAKEVMGKFGEAIVKGMNTLQFKLKELIERIKLGLSEGQVKQNETIFWQNLTDIHQTLLKTLIDIKVSMFTNSPRSKRAAIYYRRNNTEAPRRAAEDLIIGLFEDIASNLMKDSTPKIAALRNLVSYLALAELDFEETFQQCKTHIHSYKLDGIFGKRWRKLRSKKEKKKEKQKEEGTEVTSENPGTEEEEVTNPPNEESSSSEDESIEGVKQESKGFLQQIKDTVHKTGEWIKDKTQSMFDGLFGKRWKKMSRYSALNRIKGMYGLSNMRRSVKDGYIAMNRQSAPNRIKELSAIAEEYQDGLLKKINEATEEFTQKTQIVIQKIQSELEQIHKADVRQRKRSFYEEIGVDKGFIDNPLKYKEIFKDRYVTRISDLREYVRNLVNEWKETDPGTELENFDPCFDAIQEKLELLIHLTDTFFAFLRLPDQAARRRNGRPQKRANLKRGNAMIYKRRPGRRHKHGI